MHLHKKPKNCREKVKTQILQVLPYLCLKFRQTALCARATGWARILADKYEHSRSFSHLKNLSLGLRKYYQRHLFFPNERRIRDLVISYLRGTRVLDAGCGNGWLSVCAWEEGFNVYSLDVAVNEVRESLFLFKEKNAHIGLTRASLLSLPFARSSFDSIICINVLEHISNIEQTILEIERVLRKNGRLIVVVPNALTFGLFYDRFVCRRISARTILSRVYKTMFSLADHEISMLKLDKKERIGHNQQFTLTGIRKLLNKHGFRIVNIGSYRFLSPYLRSFCTLLGREPITAFESVDNKIAERIPPNLASEWVIVCEKFLS